MRVFFFFFLLTNLSRSVLNKLTMCSSIFFGCYNVQLCVYMYHVRSYFRFFLFFTCDTFTSFFFFACIKYIGTTTNE